LYFIAAPAMQAMKTSFPLISRRILVFFLVLLLAERLSVSAATVQVLVANGGVRNHTVSIPSDNQTARFDVNVSGRIDAGDVTATRNASVTVLP
jgi:hypothetical protein